LDVIRPIFREIFGFLKTELSHPMLLRHIRPYYWTVSVLVKHILLHISIRG